MTQAVNNSSILNMEDDEGEGHICTASLLMGRSALRFFIALNIFLAITATLGNTVILAALYKESSLHPPSKILLRSLALTDLCVGILSEPLFVAYVMTVDYENWKLCYNIVDVAAFSGEVLWLLSLFTLTAISVDRLLALLLGMRYRQVVTVKRVLGIMICAWTLIIGLSSAVFWNNSITLLYMFIVNVLCIMVSTCCYIKIYHKLLHHQAQIQQHVHQGQPNGDEPLNIARYRKTVSSTLWVQILLVVCYLPVGIVSATMAIGGITSPLVVAWTVCTTLVFFNSSLNPIVYCWKIRGVRRAAIDTVKHILCCLSSSSVIQI